MKTFLMVIIFALLLLIIPTFSAFAGPPMYHPILANPDDLVRADPWEEVTSGGNTANDNHQATCFQIGIPLFDYAITTLRISLINYKFKASSDKKAGISANYATSH